MAGHRAGAVWVAAMETTRDDYDSVWKEALETYFEQFIGFFFPQADREIDWTKGYEFLDKELQEAGGSTQTGTQRVDKLAKVWRRDGEETWVLIHIEVQSQVDANFAQRMYVYNYRLFDHHQKQVASFAVLGDERPNWRPGRYRRELWGCKTEFSFPTVKLLEYRQRWSELESSANPFAVVVMAHLKAKETHGDTDQRLAWKVALIRGLYERGYTKEDILKLFRFIDWLLQLPQEAERLFWKEVQSYEEEKKMTYITSVERIGIEEGYKIGMQEGIQKGVQEGLQQGLQKGLREGLWKAIELGLEMKFGVEGIRLMPLVKQVQDIATLQTLYERLRTAQSVDEIRYLLQPPDAHPAA